MKRSKVLEKICTRLYQLVQNIEERPDIECVVKDQFSEIILGDLEKLGMEPPPYQEEYGTSYPDNFGQEITDVAWVQGWEQE